ncbi:MAG: PBECR4 domain-containing protein [Lachnospiraceae bacterium]|nr:PBECR4 domain-containing protein [Lachnospiraceae bacterium]
MQYTKKDAVRIVVNCAELYRDELNNRNLLFVCLDKHKRISYIEVSFHDYSYMHLTGLRPVKKQSGEDLNDMEQLTADMFYDLCLNHKLSPDDFEFSDKGTTPLKLEVLPMIMNKNLAANMVGDFNSLRPKLYTEKLAGGTKACVGFVKDKKNGEYIPNTVLKEDLRSNVSDYVRVIATYRKNINDRNYSEIVYAAKKVDWTKIRFSEEYSYLPMPITVSG